MLLERAHGNKKMDHKKEVIVTSGLSEYDPIRLENKNSSITI